MKREINYLKNKFSFLQIKCNYKITEVYKANTYFYVVWSGKKNIKIVYDFMDDYPISVYVYDIDDMYMFNYKYFNKEINLVFLKKDNYRNYKKIIDFAAQKIIEKEYQNI